MLSHKHGNNRKQDEPTEWVNSITVVRKPNKIKPNPTKLNRAILRSAHHTRTIEEVLLANTDHMLDANSGYWRIRLDEYSSKLCIFNTP